MSMLAKSKRLTAKANYSMIAARQRSEAAEKELVESRRLKGVQDAFVAGEARANNKRQIRQDLEMMEEREMENALIQRERNKNIKAEHLDQEERMADELRRLNIEKTRNEKLRQQICQNSVELRELEAKLRQAYIHKEHQAQIAEKELSKYELLQQEAEQARALEEERSVAEAYQQQALEERARAQMDYKHQLQKQLKDREQKKRDDYEEFMREKMMIDEIVRKIQEDDQREREREMERKQVAGRYVKEYQRERERWHEIEKRRNEEENVKLKEYALEKEIQERERAAVKRAQSETHEKFLAKMADKMYAEQRERDEMDQIRQDLFVEEQLERLRQAEKDEIEKHFRKKLELQKVAFEQRRIKELQKVAEKEEEEQYRQELLAKFAEDDRIEQMNAQKRRMKQLEHRRAVEQLIEDKREQRIRYKEDEEAELQDQREAEKMKQQIIEEERLKLLQEHAARLIGHLPKGVIRDSRDLDMLGPEFREAYCNKQGMSSACQ